MFNDWIHWLSSLHPEQWIAFDWGSLTLECQRPEVPSERRAVALSQESDFQGMEAVLGRDVKQFRHVRGSC